MSFETTNAHLESLLQSLFFQSGSNYEAVLSTACEIAVFGSRAVGVNSPTSDLDILVISGQKTDVRVAGVDMVMLTPIEIEKRHWLESELASHVSQYGRWIRGVGSWRSETTLGDYAFMRKRHRVGSLLAALEKRWKCLHPVFRAKYVVTIRRELQRLDILMHRTAVPATPLLDQEWKVGSFSAAHLKEIAARVGLAARMEAMPDLASPLFELAAHSRVA